MMKIWILRGDFDLVTPKLYTTDIVTTNYKNGIINNTSSITSINNTLVFNKLPDISVTNGYTYIKIK